MRQRRAAAATVGAGNRQHKNKRRLPHSMCWHFDDDDDDDDDDNDNDNDNDNDDNDNDIDDDDDDDNNRSERNYDKW